MSALLILIIPLVAAVLVSIPFKKNWPGYVTIVSCVLILILALYNSWKIVTGVSLTDSLPHAWLEWVAVDGLSVLVMLLIAFVGTTASIFSLGYMAHGKRKDSRLPLYYANYNLFIFSMMAIPVAAEPTMLWIIVELTTLCSALLVSFENTREALEAAWKYVVLSLMGAGVALFGFLLLYAALQAAGGSYTWAGLVVAAPRMPPVLLKTAFVLILMGLGTKVGLVPMHTWLPDAHSQAPSPVCALLSGVETTSILYVILRLFPVMRSMPDSHAQTLALILGLLSTGVAAFLLLQVRDYKRLFAFSTVEHMGIILTAVGIGACADYGAMQQMVAHSVTKSFCFFAAGATLLTVETREISAVRNLIRRSPWVGAALVLGGLAITGAPPLAVFLSEFLILKAGLNQGQYVVTGLLAFFIVVAFFGIWLHLNRMVFDVTPNHPMEDQNQTDRPEEEKFKLPWSCQWAMILAAIPVVVLGVYQPKPLQELLTLAAATLTK